MSDIIKCPACKNTRPFETSHYKMIGEWIDFDWSPARFDQNGNMIPRSEIKEARLMRCNNGHNFTVKI